MSLDVAAPEQDDDSATPRSIMGNKQERNNTASKKSSDHPGQYAFAVRKEAGINLGTKAVPLPVGAEHIPDPAAGQLLITGEPAPTQEQWAELTGRALPKFW